MKGQRSPLGTGSRRRAASDAGKTPAGSSSVEDDDDNTTSRGAVSKGNFSADNANNPQAPSRIKRSARLTRNLPVSQKSTHEKTEPVESLTPTENATETLNSSDNSNLGFDSEQELNNRSENPVAASEKRENTGGPEGSQKRKRSSEPLSKLTAIDETGKRVSSVTIIIDDEVYSPGRNNAHLGQDGNQYYCQVCNGFGNVVCCDGCPRVYHRECIPTSNPSRISLDDDDDPWFCPECTEQKNGDTRKQSSMLDELASAEEDSNKMFDRRTRRTRAASSGAEHEARNHNSPYQENSHENSDRRITRNRGMSSGTEHEARYRNSPYKDLDSEMDDIDEDGELEEEEDLAEERHSKRKRKKIHPDKKKKKKKKKKTKKETLPDPRGVSSEGANEEPPIMRRRSSSGLPQATPAFYFYLGENRWRMERTLARKHRYFNRLPKGTERNALVAQEAASCWCKLREREQKRYVNMSIRDYEARIIEWKEEKNINDMSEDVGDDFFGDEEIPEDGKAGDDLLTYQRHDKLYLSTSVGSKAFKTEPNQSYNRVLLDLLHDMRFHPLPMFSINRPENETVIDEHSSKVTIPYFDVHGPISTSVGDECLGCARGWTHFCPVLKRRLSAIEHRAKLQPPLSSLTASRVGLGLRPRLERFEKSEESEDNTNNDGAGELLCWRDTKEQKEMRLLPIVPSSSMSNPSERADDIVQFIEETMAMKVPEPPRPDPPVKMKTALKKATMSGRSLPTKRCRDAPIEICEKTSIKDVFNKCGRCRTIIQNDTGCVQCRRAQLVINMSKRQATARSNSVKPMLKVHTAMLGRVQMKEGSGESQAEGDQAVGNAILKMRWAPSCIVAPQKSLAPSATRRESDNSCVFEKDSSDESEEEQDGEDISVNENVQDEMETEFTTLGENGEDDSNDSQSKEDEVEKPKEEEVEKPKEEEVESRFGKRQRSTRSVPTKAPISFSDSDRQQIAERNKKETSELHKKTVSTACCGILRALMRRDPLHLFAEPVTVEGYSKIVKNPMDFGKIRSKVIRRKYANLGEFVSDATLLCENALVYNPSGSIYWKTAKELHEILMVMQKRASDWMKAVKSAHKSFLRREDARRREMSYAKNSDEESDSNAIDDSPPSDPFEELREDWPEAVEMLESSEWMMRQLESDFMRTKENEVAYYGCLAVRRVSAAAEASLAPYTDSGGVYSVVSKRSHVEDEGLRDSIDKRVSELSDPPIELKEISTGREESVVRLMRKVQSRRLERRIVSDNGCARCDGLVVDQELKKVMNAESTHMGKVKKKVEADAPRVDPSRVDLTTGLASINTRELVEKHDSQKNKRTTKNSREDVYDEASVNRACVSVRGSKIHGWGLFADQEFGEGDVVAEYIGEYIGNPVADLREKTYQDQRIQDYQFRLDEKLVLDATMKGGSGRYINHNCTPNCLAKIIPGEAPNEHLKRVIIIAQRNIGITEEITYDYQFPLELNLDARIPCNCQSDACRGFMNWDLPEKGSNNRALLVQKRGANMRDRIRRLGRPLKRDET